MIKTYIKNDLEPVDAAFRNSLSYGRVKLNSRILFFRKGLRWHYVEFTDAQHIFRRVEPVDTKMCCGNVSFDRQFLVILLNDGTELEILLGEGNEKEASALLEKIKAYHPDLKYGFK